MDETRNHGMCIHCKQQLREFSTHYCLKIGAHIYYSHKNKDTYPGIILAIKPKTSNMVSRKFQIRYNGLTGDKTVWVMPNSIRLQD